MSTVRKERPETVFKALASEARLRIVQHLGSGGERCVCELVACCGLGWSTVSHHLAVLREAGIVQDRKSGQQVFYRLVLPCVVRFIECLEGTDPRYESLWGTGCCDSALGTAGAVE